MALKSICASSCKVFLGRSLLCCSIDFPGKCRPSSSSQSTQAASEQTEATAKSNAPASHESLSFGMNLFLGRCQTAQVFPYPANITADERETLSQIIGPTERFFQEVNDAAKNDAESRIDASVLRKMGELGAFGVLVPLEYGGSAFNNTQMGRLAEIVGAHDLAIGVTMGAHQSIGYKGILLYGTEQQKRQYLPDLATGNKFAAFCLTEPSSGSDANSIKSRAELSADGKHYVLNGSKIWISNGGFADVFTVFAQTPVTKNGVTKDKVSAFIVERAFGGLTHGPAEHKMGIKGSSTNEVYFDNVKIPVENILSTEGDGFKVAMNILNNGRFGIPAAMTGTMRWCIQKAVEHVTTRTQFGRKLDEFGGIQEKIANMVIKQYLSESITYMLSGVMDGGAKEYQIEAAIGKIVASEAAWYVCDEAIQILGGMGYMLECGLERVLRDLRIFRIFEGTNDILRLFVALTGIQYAGGHLKEVQKALKNPAANIGLLLEQAGKRVSRMAGISKAASLDGTLHADLAPLGKLLSQDVELFGVAVENLLVKFGKQVVEEQCLLTRLADAAIDIYCMAVMLSRASHSLAAAASSAAYERQICEVFCRQADERVRRNLAVLESSRHRADFDVMAQLSRQACLHSGPVQQHPLGV